MAKLKSKKVCYLGKRCGVSTISKNGKTRYLNYKGIARACKEKVREKAACKKARFQAKYKKSKMM